MKKKYIITEKNWCWRDGIYCDWFSCPVCKNKGLTTTDNFCSECGAAVKFKLSKPENYC